MPQRPTLAIVIPVYRGGAEFSSLLRELNVLDSGIFDLTEIVCVNDCGPRSAVLEMIAGAELDNRVQNVWLARNSGQHAASVAGFSASTADWVATIDEDGMHDPIALNDMLLRAESSGAAVVYGHPSNAVPHPAWRNATSKIAKRIATILFGVSGADQFSSFRLVRGDVARGLAAYTTYGQYLDVALTWYSNSSTSVKVPYRRSVAGHASGYSFGRLARHFQSLALTSGTRPIRVIGIMGLFTALGAMMSAMILLYLNLTGRINVAGWTSLAVITLFLGGLTLLSISMVAEYVGYAVRLLLGRPPYLSVPEAPGSRAPAD